MLNKINLWLHRRTRKGTRWGEESEEEAEEDADALTCTREVDEDGSEASIWKEICDLNKP